jgi:hypothetical protein
MTYGATFADHRMSMSAALCRASMLANGVDKVLTIDSDHIGAGRGAGYWRWMPDIVRKGIKTAIDEGAEFFVYADAGVEFVQSIRHITDRMATSDHVFLFGNEHSHEHWCKGDVLTAMDWQGSVNDKQVQASVHIWRASWEAFYIATEWDRACSPKWMIDDSPSTKPNHPSFNEHRHPQATLTCIAHRHDIPLHWWPSEYGHYIKHLYRDTYPQLFDHHRKRNPSVVEAMQPVWDEHEYNKRMGKYYTR